MKTVDLCSLDVCCGEDCENGPLLDTDDVQFQYVLPQAIADFQSIEFTVRDYMSGVLKATLSGSANGSTYSSGPWVAEKGNFVVVGKVTTVGGSEYHLKPKVIHVGAL